jgi:acetolactate decarboxylase
MKNIKIITLLTLSSLTIFIASAQQVKLVGNIKNVIRKGKLYGNINIDTIVNKEHLFGIGIVENLTGELLIIDGKSYRSVITSDSSLKIEETNQIKAPFFAYSNVSKWWDENLPDSVLTFKQLEVYLNQIAKNSTKPIFFKLMGTIEKATIHVVNLPEGTKVRSNEDAQKGQMNYNLSKKNCEIIGVLSSEHQSIFTPQGTYFHMHLITADRTKMGHLDDVVFKKGTMVISMPIE